MSDSIISDCRFFNVGLRFGDTHPPEEMVTISVTNEGTILGLHQVDILPRGEADLIPTLKRSWHYATLRPRYLWHNWPMVITRWVKREINVYLTIAIDHLRSRGYR